MDAHHDFEINRNQETTDNNFLALSGEIGDIAKLRDDSISAVKPDSIPKSNQCYKHSTFYDIAVIGMAGRFPGADTVDQLWEILKLEKETIRFFSKSELDNSISPDVKNDPEYVSARGVINNADKFDAAFFDLNPKLATLMDPQHRIFLEIAWEVLENTGHLPDKYKGSIGVFAGTGNNTYYSHNVLANPDLIDQVGGFQVSTLNEKDYVATRAAYHLNLKGPAISVHSSCSTSLLAISQAVECIRKGQCDVAIAGGISITSPIHSGHLYQEGAMLSRDGHCRTFDANASGTVFSDGAGVVLLKGLDAAKLDGDLIYAVIKGVGFNNDGGGKGSFSTPSSEGQAGAIAMAIQDAGIDAATITYVEAHGTATPVGDPVEINGLKMAFGNQPKNQFCAIGSVKSNIGHLTAAAGVTGLIKTVLALHHRQIPASLGFSNPNLNIDFENSPFYVNTKLIEWQSETARRAGVSSFGVGGTNVHVVLEEFENKVSVSSNGRPIQLITWSAKSEESLGSYATKLAGFLKEKSGINIADTAFTLQTTRANFNNRKFVLAHNAEELINSLEKDWAPMQSVKPKESSLEVVFMYPGQGCQYLNMGLELYESELVYKEAIDKCAEILLPFTGLDIRTILFPRHQEIGAEDRLKNTRYTQPAIFATEYALTKLWISWGIEPTVLCGHSIGEFVAAHFAGVFTLPEALKLIACRGKMISEVPRGSMLSVRMTAKELAAILPDGLTVAAINSHRLCVVAGEDKEITGFSKLLAEKGLPNKILLTSHAFHSAMMDSVIEDFEKVVLQVTLKAPHTAMISTQSGTWLTNTQATDPNYWSTHLRSTVLFADATETVLTKQNALIVEVGPGNTLSTLIRQQSGLRGINLVTSLDTNSQRKSECASLLNALGQLWIFGLVPDWNKFYEGQNRIKITVPSYAFNRKNCWINPSMSSADFMTGNKKSQGEDTHPKYIVPRQNVNRQENIKIKIKKILQDASGINTNTISPDITFLEMGLDSLLMTQIALTLKKQFDLPLTFRRLNEEFKTISLLAQYLDEKLPEELFQSIGSRRSSSSVERSNIPDNIDHTQNDLSQGLELIALQLQVLTKQVAMLQEGKGLVTHRNGADLPVVGYNSKSSVMPTVVKSHNGVSRETSDLDISTHSTEFARPPVPGAKLGRDKEGNTGWYISDKARPGKFLRVELNS